MRLLIDENISPLIVGKLAANGIYAAHVAHVGLAGKSDPAIFRYAFDNDFIVVTINAADFITLAADAHCTPA